MPTFTRTPLRDDLCAFCRHPSLNELNDDDKKKKELIKNDFNNVCPACLNCFSFFSLCSSPAPSKTSSEEEEEEDKDKEEEEGRARASRRVDVQNLCRFFSREECGQNGAS